MTVELHLDAGSGSVVASADDGGLRVESGGQRFEAPWDEVVAGFGRVEHPARDGSDTQPEASAMLLVARGRGRERRDPLAVPLPGDDPDVTAFVDEVRRRAGAGWVGEGVGYPDLAAHVFDPPTPARALGDVPRGLVAIAFLMAALAVWGLFESGQVESPFSALGITIVLTGVLVLLFRLRVRR